MRADGYRLFFSITTGKTAKKHGFLKAGISAGCFFNRRRIQ
jgi:hypothetical protein